MATYVTRQVDPLLDELFREFPALLIVGPRATGKTTTVARLAHSVVHLDQIAEAAAFAADPDAALRRFDEPILLDEWQEVPHVLGAVKRAVDTDSRPGRFLITGSVRGDLDHSTWPGTGRLIRVPMAGMTVRELLGRSDGTTFIDRVVTGTPLETPVEKTDLAEYVDWAVRGGFPDAALDTRPGRWLRWLHSYVEQLVTRDAELVDSGRDPDRLRRFIQVCAVQSATVVDERTIHEAAGINRKTAQAYEQLLKNLFVLDAVPAWTSNRLKRLVLTPKRYMVDSGLVAGALGVDAHAVLRDGTLLGRILETFVVAQLRAEVAISSAYPRLYHLRQQQGRHEVDIVVELGGQRVIGIEIKAGAAPRAADAKHLIWLREHLGNRFVRGVVLHTGPYVFELDDRITAAPICTLWS